LALLVGVGIRLFGLTRQPLWIDELLTLQGASLGEPFRWHDVLINPQGPLPHLLLRGWTAVVGAGDLSLRSWAAAGGVLGLVLAMLAFRRARPRAALLATWLLALSPFHIWYSQEVRGYVFMLAATALALWTFVRAWERPSPAAWAGHAAALVALLLCNLSAITLLPALGAALLFDRRNSLRPWLLAAAAALLVVSPWLRVEFAGHVEWSEVVPGGGTTPLRAGGAFHPGALPFTYATFIGGFGLGPPLRDLHGALTPALFRPVLPWLALAVLATGTALAAAARGWREPELRRLFWWAFLPALGISVVAALGLKAYNPRYAAVSQPILILLLAEGILRIGRARRVFGVILGGGLVLCMLAGWGRQTFDERYAREDFRGAARFLETHAAAGDLVLQQGVNGPLARYYRGAADIETFFEVYFRADDGGEGRLDRLAAGHPRVWWVGSRLWYEDPRGRVLDMLERRGGEIARWNGPGVEIRGFALAGDAP
jgi:4-amino-4-deoxy-L-arabinose transferase-like glycosyltransferase